MSDCELGGHPQRAGASHVLKWCCPQCLKIYRGNREEIAVQAELNREFKLANRRSPYTLVPYLALALAFTAFLIVLL